MTKEQKFYKTLQDVFIGAKIEGEGGFINLMRIKSGYYSQIEKLLREDINKAIEKHLAFREELFDKLYSFFSRYFTESGSIYFNSTPFHNNVYEKVYTDEKDVILFWKTQMLYYVKTDRIFRSIPVEFENLKLYFDASQIENKKANEKRALYFEIKQVREDGTIVFAVNYSERGTKTKNDEILKDLKKKNITVSEELLEKAFRVFEKQSEVDFFINKNAKAFLQEQFKLWSYQYFWDGAKEWSGDRVNQLQILKNISFKIIDFISQFEDELVKIWNKPKFVRKSNYVITLDRITDNKLVEKILKHVGINEQIKEWRELGIVDDKFKVKDIEDKKYEHLPIDTKYFKDLELEILSLFDDLDNQLDGWLIKSENYQALNTILPKFKEKIQTIYIDPPFNLDSSDQFIYRTNYKDSNWASLLENRLQYANDWLNEKGIIFVRCDYNGNWIVRCLMDSEFDKNNFQNELVVNRIKKNVTEKGKRNIPAQVDSIFVYRKSEKAEYVNVLKKLDTMKESYWHAIDSAGIPGPRQAIIEGKIFYPPKGCHFKFTQKQTDEMYASGRIRINPKSEKPQYLVLEKEVANLDTNWTDISGYSFSTGFQTENSEVLINRVLEVSSQRKDLVLDFFLGSGTTTAVAHKLGRKWVGVEMGEHFYGVVLPRMKKVLAYDKGGVSKNVKEYQGGGFFKYFELEQYEDALRNCKYDGGDLFSKTSEKAYQDYVFMKDEKMLSALEIDYKNNMVKVDLTKLYSDIDIAETLSNWTGKWIKTIKDSEVEFADGTKINTKNLDYKLIKPLIWW